MRRFDELEYNVFEGANCFPGPEEARIVSSSSPRREAGLDGQYQRVRRTRFSSSCRSAEGRLGLKGSTVACRDGDVNNAASGPR